MDGKIDDTIKLNIVWKVEFSRVEATRSKWKHSTRVRHGCVSLSSPGLPLSIIFYFTIGPIAVQVVTDVHRSDTNAAGKLFH